MPVRKWFIFWRKHRQDDQYATRDQKFDSNDAMHSLLYKDEVDHPKDVFYVFVCRCTLGEPLETRTGDNSCFATRLRRELTPIEGTTPPEPHHSLIARVCNHSLDPSGKCRHGCRLAPDRYSEFCDLSCTHHGPIRNTWLHITANNKFLIHTVNRLSRRSGNFGHRDHISRI